MVSRSPPIRIGSSCRLRTRSRAARCLALWTRTYSRGNSIPANHSQAHSLELANEHGVSLTVEFRTLYVSATRSFSRSRRDGYRQRTGGHYTEESYRRGDLAGAPLHYAW